MKIEDAIKSRDFDMLLEFYDGILELYKEQNKLLEKLRTILERI
jgi:hypothetical protein